jgi:hypothetical protein
LKMAVRYEGSSCCRLSAHRALAALRAVYELGV